MVLAVIPIMMTMNRHRYDHYHHDKPVILKTYTHTCGREYDVEELPKIDRCGRCGEIIYIPPQPVKKSKCNFITRWIRKIKGYKALDSKST